MGKLIYKGHFYVVAKGHDNEIVRALETHSKAVHGNLILEFVWSWAF
jgi:hypothetical protein